MENINHKEIYSQILKTLTDNGLEIRENHKLANDILSLMNRNNANDLQVAKATIFSKDIIKKGTICPCCEQNVKINWKKIDSQMAYCLIKLYRLTKAKPDVEFFHVEDDIDVPLKVGGSWAKLRWWGLIIQKPKEEGVTVKRTSGYWCITEKGKNFVKNIDTVQKYVKLYNMQCHGLDGEQVSIYDALGDKFDYVELMNTHF